MKFFGNSNNNLTQNVSSVGAIGILLSLLNHYLSDSSTASSSSSTNALLYHFLVTHLTMIPAFLHASPMMAGLPWNILALTNLSRHYLAPYLPTTMVNILDTLNAVHLQPSTTAAPSTITSTLGSLLHPSTSSSKWYEPVISNVYLGGLAALFRVDQSAAFVALATASYTKLIMNNVATFFHYLPAGGAKVLSTVSFVPMVMVSSFVIGAALILSSRFPNLGIPGSRRLYHGLNFHTLLHSFIIGTAITLLSLYSSSFGSTMVTPSMMEQVISPSVAAFLYKALVKYVARGILPTPTVAGPAPPGTTTAK